PRRDRLAHPDRPGRRAHPGRSAGHGCHRPPSSDAGQQGPPASHTAPPPAVQPAADQRPAPSLPARPMSTTRRSPAAQRRNAYAYGVLAVAIFLGLLGFGYSAQNGLFWQGHYLLGLEVRDAANLAPHAIVRI